MKRDKSAKFIELANKRVNRAVKDIKLIANLSNRRNYDFSEEQAKKIIKALQHEVDQVKKSFTAEDDYKENVFEL